MPWSGIDDSIQALGRMKVRVRAATAEAAVAGAAIIREAAKRNILARFVQRTGDLYRSMYSDSVATALGQDKFSARAFPRGAQFPTEDSTPYGRIQELGGIIEGQFGRDQLLWFRDLTGRLISVPEVELGGRWYLRDAVIESLGPIHESAARYWKEAI
jgi:hypothetical protein